ncbi:MAG: helix-turn-helix transcriptional regulator [Nannocystaceae bacterium]
MTFDRDFPERRGGGSDGGDDAYDPRDAAERHYMTDLGQRLRRLREDRGLTQQALARISAVAADMISRLENGHYQSPGLRTLLRLADGLGVAIGELLPEAQGLRGAAPSGGGGKARLFALVKRVSPEDAELTAGVLEAIIRGR